MLDEAPKSNGSFRPIADITPRVQNAMTDEDEQRWEEKLKRMAKTKADKPE